MHLGKCRITNDDTICVRIRDGNSVRTAFKGMRPLTQFVTNLILFGQIMDQSEVTSCLSACLKVGNIDGGYKTFAVRKRYLGFIADRFPIQHFIDIFRDGLISRGANHFFYMFPEDIPLKPFGIGAIHKSIAAICSYVRDQGRQRVDQPLQLFLARTQHGGMTAYEPVKKQSRDQYIDPAFRHTDGSQHPLA